jgi:hypothetical protein
MDGNSTRKILAAAVVLAATHSKTAWKENASIVDLGF